MTQEKKKRQRVSGLGDTDPARSQTWFHDFVFLLFFLIDVFRVMAAIHDIFVKLAFSSQTADEGFQKRVSHLMCRTFLFMCQRPGVILIKLHKAIGFLLRLIRR